jgi:hypothetical protein
MIDGRGHSPDLSPGFVYDVPVWFITENDTGVGAGARRTPGLFILLRQQSWSLRMTKNFPAKAGPARGVL